MSNHDQLVAFVRLKKYVEEIIASKYGAELLRHLNVPVYQILPFGCPPNYGCLWSLLENSGKFTLNNIQTMRESLAKIDHFFFNPTALDIFDDYSRKYLATVSSSESMVNLSQKEITFSLLKENVQSLLIGPHCYELLLNIGIDPNLYYTNNIWSIMTMQNVFHFGRVKPIYEAFVRLGPYAVSGETIQKFKDYETRFLLQSPESAPPSPLRSPKQSQKQSQNQSPKQSPDNNAVSSPQVSNCVVCLDVKSNVVLLACGHICTCKNCSESLEKCPLCRSAIQQRYPIYFS